MSEIDTNTHPPPFLAGLFVGYLKRDITQVELLLRMSLLLRFFIFIIFLRNRLIYYALDSTYTLTVETAQALKTGIRANSTGRMDKLALALKPGLLFALAFSYSYCKNMNMRHINEKGLALVKEFEGCELEAYLCPAGVWTIGFGHTRSVAPGMLIDEFQAEGLLREDLRETEEAVGGLVTVSINDNQFSALVSLAFNLGAFVALAGEEKSAFERSTLLKMLNAGAESETVAAQFLRWNKVGDEEFPGLTRRRHAERVLFLEPQTPH